jgi:hypothetical protein
LVGPYHGAVTPFARVEWARVAERLCFLFPPVIGVGVVGLLQDAELGVPGVGLALVLVGSFGYALLTVALAGVLYLDARRIRRDPESAWEPRPVVAALTPLVLAPVVLAPLGGTFYLYRRHRQFGTPAGPSWWWIGVSLTLATTVAGVVVAVVGFVVGRLELVSTAIGLAGVVAVGVFPVAIHQDAAYVCNQESNWHPNPAAFLAVALLSLFVPVVQPPLAAYYLVRRYRALGEW